MTTERKTVKVEDIRFRQDLYPRLETSATTVQKYAEDLSVLPDIEVNQHNDLIDGWHRWTAHKKNGVEKIRVVVTETVSDAHLLELAIERNAKFGLQLSQADKKKMAVRIYNGVLDRKERLQTKARLWKLLSVSESVLDAWLSRSEKDMKEQAREDAFNYWLACHTQDVIAETVGWPKMTVNGWLKSLYENANSEESVQTADPNSDDTGDTPLSLSKKQMADADHATDFTPPIYNIWKQQEKTKGSDHFGNSEVRWVDNLLYLYTKPFDVVIDPFAGGGSTIDVCRKRLRRYFVSDRKPIVEAGSEGVPLHKRIRQHDIVTDGLPKPPQWKDVRLVYLDPPYWKQAEGRYSDDPTDLANMDLESFSKTLSGVISAFSKKMSEGSHIALIIQPTQWNAPDRQFTDHIGDMLRMVKLPVAMRISAPYESQQCNAQMVDWAKDNKTLLVITREIVVWKV